MADAHFLSPDRIRIEQQDKSLVLVMDGQRMTPAGLRRALPLSEPNNFIVFHDEEGNEIGIIRSVDELEPESQQVLRDALARAYVITRITRILEVDKEPLTGQTRWRVEIEPSEQVEPVELEIETNSNEIATAPGAESNGRSVPTANESTSNNTVSSNDESGGEGDGEDNTDQPGRLKRVGRLFGFNRDNDKYDDSQQAEEREFMINGQEDVQTARYPHIYIVDTDRNRYEIINCEALDADSRKAAERFF